MKKKFNFELKLVVKVLSYVYFWFSLTLIWPLFPKNKNFDKKKLEPARKDNQVPQLEKTIPTNVKFEHLLKYIVSQKS